MAGSATEGRAAEPAAKKKAVESKDGPAAVPKQDEPEENPVYPPFASIGEQDAFFAQIEKLTDKIHECIPVWDELLASGKSKPFFEKLTSIDLADLPIPYAHSILVVLIAAFQSLEVEAIREHFWKFTGLPLFLNLSQNRLRLELEAFPKLKKPYAKLEKNKAQKEAERSFIPRIVSYFLSTLAKADALAQAKGIPEEHIQMFSRMCCRCVEFFIDLLAQMPTRRFLHAYLEDCHVLLHCKRAFLFRPDSPAGRLFYDMVDIFRFYMMFEVNNQTAEAMTDNDCESFHSAKVMAFQRVAHRFFSEKLKELSMSNISNIEERNQLLQFIHKLTDEELCELCSRLCILDDAIVKKVKPSRDFLCDVLLYRHERRTSQVARLNALALYPTEEMLWNYYLVPSERYTGEQPLAVPKLNMQFLTIHDYLLRNFTLMQLESTYEVREDIEEALRRMGPYVTDGALAFRGKSRMALPLHSVQVTKVAPPPIGSTRPAEVRAELHVSFASIPNHFVRSEWEQLRQHDVLILIGLGLNPSPGNPNIQKRYHVTYVRGCEILDVRDDDDNVFTGLGDSGVQLTGDNRHFRVRLDPAQYQKDVTSGKKVYENLTLVMRRRPKENNFKAILETIRDLMNFPAVVPKWLHDIFLGYGDADSAHYSKMDDQIADINFVDTLIDTKHVEEAFPGKRIKWKGDKDKLERPFKIRFPVERDDSDDEGDVDMEQLKDDEIEVEAAPKPVAGPYPEDIPKQNAVRFSDVQVEAIKAASNPGLTIVVGPPGTGKTDVAVQVISNIYHNFPGQTTLVVTHSNAALNDIFEKTALKDIDERYLLRLGMGEKELRTEKDYSKWGRVNYMLQRRLALLQKVEKVARCVGVDTSFAYTCETSAHFYRHHVLSRWERFLQSTPKEGAKDREGAEWVKQHFPFAAFFDDTPQPLWNGCTTFDSAFEAAKSAWVHLQRVFDELNDCRAFELLRSSHDRGNYLVTRQAKIIAMTCTHAALKRRDFVRLAFKYDNLVMEESAQILEIETFIPMLLQNPNEDGESRLKRIVLIGDHNQLPPVVKNLSFQKYSHFDQSLFTRFVRLGVPIIQLNAQGRMRKQLADLYRWRYKDLKDLPHIATEDRFKTANAGFSYVYQCINVEDFQGKGESEPQKFFYQNLAEAEYVVHTYMYMRLIGYPASKITILTTYNGQKHLIRDVIAHRCGANTIYGEPPRVTTVDKFQGQQNDYILLSLVRTQKVGHLRDPRRLVVAMSRARLGLYVFCRVSLFKGIWELKPAFDQLLRRPTDLALNLDEVSYPTTRLENDEGKKYTVKDFVEYSHLVVKMSQTAVQIEGQKYLAKQKEQEEAEKRVKETLKSSTFEECLKWRGPREGWYFGTGEYGLGYYKDPRKDEDVAKAVAESQSQAPVRMTNPVPVQRKRRDVEESDSEDDDDVPTEKPAPIDHEKEAEERRVRALELVKLAKKRALDAMDDADKDDDDE